MVSVLLTLVFAMSAETHTSLQELRNCYFFGTKASVDCNRNLLCFTIIPTEIHECDILPSTVLLTLNMSAYTEPLYGVITDFSYANTTSLCVECPTGTSNNVVMCKAGLKDSKYISLSISSETHKTDIPVMNLHSLNLNLSQCYTPNATVYTESLQTSPKICAMLEPTGSCSIIDDSGVGQYVSSFLYIYAAGNTFTYQLDTKFSASQTLICNAQQNIDVTGLMKSILEDEWSYGSFKLNFNLDGRLYSSETRLFRVITNLHAGCLGLTDIEIYPEYISLFVRESSSDAENCEIDTDKYFVIEPTIYLCGIQTETIRIRNFIVVGYYDFSQQYHFLIPCQNTSLCTEVYDNLVKTNDSKELYTASYSVRFIASNGSPAAIVDGYVGSISAPCWVKSYILVYKNYFSVSLEPSGALSCPITQKTLNYTITATINRIQKENPMWKDQQVILTLQLKTEFDINKTLITFYCSNEALSSSQTAIDNCHSTIAQLYSKRESRSVNLHFVGKDLFFNELVNLNHVVYGFRNLDYATANITSISVATIVSIGYLIFIVMLYVSIVKNMHVLLHAIEQRL
ncbi:Hypothetical protein GLP15_2352 [Giardia lamblia P15]|uniref:Uncharacterized protein n=1 Tax=Giardia intestinalis (strain P15) TaxID=658858 RepID=E1F4X8_GIAIA|nr:Hypothetical protein GLP15_2352 [Giardia lamblia P15]